MGFDVTVRVRWPDFPLFLPVVTSSGLRDAAAVDKLVDDAEDFVLLSVVLLLVVVVLVVVGVALFVVVLFVVVVGLVVVDLLASHVRRKVMIKNAQIPTAKFSFKFIFTLRHGNKLEWPSERKTIFLMTSVVKIPDVRRRRGFIE